MCGTFAWPRVVTAKHAATEAKRQVQRGLLLDIVVPQSVAVLEPLAHADQYLLVRPNPRLLLDLE